jgi:hypothetical protein
MTSFYVCAVDLKVLVRVEGESLAEAERIIEGILDNASTVQIIEGSITDPIDEMAGTRLSHSCGPVVRERN